MFSVFFFRNRFPEENSRHLLGTLNPGIRDPVIELKLWPLICAIEAQNSWNHDALSNSFQVDERNIKLWIICVLIFLFGILWCRRRVILGIKIEMMRAPMWAERKGDQMNVLALTDIQSTSRVRCFSLSPFLIHLFRSLILNGRMWCVDEEKKTSNNNFLKIVRAHASTLNDMMVQMLPRV